MKIGSLILGTLPSNAYQPCLKYCRGNKWLGTYFLSTKCNDYTLRRLQNYVFTLVTFHLDKELCLKKFLISVRSILIIIFWKFLQTVIQLRVAPRNSVTHLHSVQRPFALDSHCRIETSPNRVYLEVFIYEKTRSFNSEKRFSTNRRKWSKWQSFQ